MDNKKKATPGGLRDKPFVDIFFLESMDETIFYNYQRYDFYQLLWFKKVGSDNRYLIDFREYEVADNQVVVVFPGQIDRLNIQGKEGVLFAIHNDVFFRINQHLKSPYLSGYLSNIFIDLDQRTTNILNTIVELILLEREAANRLTIMETYTEAFLFHVASLFETKNQRIKVDSLVAELMRLIDRNFIHERETLFYSNQLGITPKKLNQACIRGTGKTLKQHLQERLVLEIKKEIRMGQKSLKEIAFDLRFNEPAYFTRFFKQHTGYTPTQFKEQESVL
ncbi:AraC family transcriptional activator of pobA [Dysgonomonas sp. PH5-45]|uniref:helix-turn-helix domain-containing protein n=1 Tax=unclassified Dysgonomonas TaxID=2630389 RepID=UPI002475D939|nr:MULTISPECIES: helix-turn-helix domain-containing protein [unclassified Dysgonomonas]MDH6354970.1 AraC family transcriptional activator of pobA [Dysgonomonas sp. PH5-45]MDH6387906.1 AraC family transcriptional activator of pobA [Dysgonomonas sp. PH5-37]